MTQNERQFEAAQQLRLRDIEVRVDDYFAKAIQLADTGAAELAGLRGDAEAAARLTVQLFASRSTAQISGVGVYYAPGAFRGGTAAFGVYARQSPGGIGSVRISFPAYERTHWYLRAREAPPDATVFAGPGPEPNSFIDTLRPFHRNGRFAGVIAVRTLRETFESRNMRPRIAPGDVAWIESSIRGKALFATSSLPAHGDRIDHYLALRYTGAYVHLSSDASALRAENRRIFSGTLAAIAVIWLFAVALGLTMLQVWRARQHEEALESEREELRSAAYTDPLTGLPNRAAFLKRTRGVLEEARGAQERSWTIFFVDLDRFNLVNETLGHVAGDEMIRLIAERLSARLQPPAWVARLGGDEFVIASPVHGAAAAQLAERILEWLREPVPLEGQPRYASASIGVITADGSFGAPEDMLRDADIAMYAAKQRGRDRYAIFDEAMRNRVEAESDLANDLRRAIERHEFVPYYQPIVDCDTRRIVSFEALVRWNRPGSGIVEAGEFMTYAERRGLVDAIDMVVFADVCRDTRDLWESFPSATISFNVSAPHLTSADFAATIDGVLHAHSVPPERLRLEITETAMMQNAETAGNALAALRRNGMQIVLDDFGAGHSSLAYLHRLPIKGLKIDRSFVVGLPEDTQAVAIVRTIVALAESLELYTVAEGVEREEQFEILRWLGVSHAQGFLFAPALPLEAARQAGQPAR